MYYDHKRYYLLHPKKGLKLIPEPVGWNEDERETGRDVDTLAKKITITNNLEFYGEAADYIREVFEDSNIQNTVKVIEEIKQPDTVAEEWEFLRDSDLDLSTYEYSNGMVTCKTSTQGLLTQIESQYKEKFSFNKTQSVQGKSITLPEEKDMLLAGREIYKYSQWNISRDTTINSGVYIVLQQDNVTQSDEAAKSVFTYNEVALLQQLESVDAFYLRAAYEQNLKIKIKYTVTFSGAFGFRLVRVKHNNDDPLDVEIVSTIQLSNESSETLITKTVEAETDRTLEYDQGFILAIINQGDLNITNIEAQLSVEEYSLFDDTTNKVMTAFNVGDGLTQILTGKTGLFKSDYLTTGSGKDLVMATGKMIRNFPKTIDGESVPFAYITTSLKEYFEHLLAADNVTWGIERTGNKEILRVEHISYFLKRNIETVLPNKVDLKTVPANDFIYSSVTLGYADVLPYEEVTGLDETNASTTWTTPVNKTDNSYELLSPYRMDSNGIELARRRQYKTDPTRDTPFDKKIFVFDAYIPTGTQYQVRNSFIDFSSVTGLITPDSSYNLRYTPAQLFKKHSNFFLGGFRKVSGDLLFASGEGNTKLETVSLGLDPVTLNESQDFTKAELLNPFFNGEIYEFYHEVTNDILKQINANFYSLFEFTTSEGETKRGFLYSVKEREGIWQILGHR